MEQRPLRLGDIVDDYCPRERRITNHAIVALIGDVIRQTRCTTCESEHVYKEAKVPKRRKKDEATLYEQVLAEAAPDARGAPADTVRPEPAVQASPSHDGRATDDEGDATVPEASSVEPDPETGVNGPADDVWFGHRRLIRASLPKTDAEPPARPIPEFTMHQRQARGSQHFRHGQPGGGNGRNGFRHGRPGGNGQGSGQGNSQGQGGRPHRGGRGRHRGGKRPR